MNEQDADALFEFFLEEANRPFSGWDFSSVADRMTSGALAWSYSSKILPFVRQAKSLLDIGTGGGEFLSSLLPLPKYTCATESYVKNVPVARKRLEPLGIKVFQTKREAPLPFEESTFDLIIDRQEWYNPVEIFRIVVPGGGFITQQVGCHNYSKIRLRLTGREDIENDPAIDLRTFVEDLETVGFTVLESQETVTFTRIFDVGALIYNLQAVPWELPDFSVEKYRESLREMHREIMQNGFLDLPDNHHRWFIMAQKPSNP